ncbi:MAG TPA: SBBP repeat-containing protein, partial [bacterium]|nr:SBBP repeat-containing protein [bacterium]
MGGKSFFHNKLFRSIMFVFLVLLFSTIALYPKTAQATSLAWNTFLGGNSQHLGYGVTTDSSGNVYAVGLTNVNWNTGMFGAPKDSIGYQGGATDGVVAKLDSTGHVLWYRILGGSINDALVNVKVDASGNVYVIGYAFGAYTFTPQATPSPVHGYVGGDIDAFVAKLASNGNLLWHTYLGSTSNDYPWGLSVDADGNVYVGGESYRVWHADFNNVIGTNKSSDGYQGYLVKLNSSGTYQWHRFLTTYAVYEVDASLSGYVHTVKKGLYYSGGWNYPAEVGKYNTTTGEQIWNTTVGSSTQDSFGIDVDTSGNVFISGSSTATWGTPIRAHAGSTDIYAAKLNSSGTLQWNTFLGSAGTDVGRSNQPGGISVDAGGNVYTMGYSSATWGTPITAHAGGSSDGFAVMLNPSGVLVWNTFLGGTNMDTMVALSASAGGDVFVSGYTQQNSWGTPVNFPTGCYYCQSVAKISNSSTLTAIKAGAGAGSVSSAPTGISCGDDCTENFSAGTSITLTATPDEGSSFAGWSGGTCSGTDPCTFSMGDSVGITATF